MEKQSLFLALINDKRKYGERFIVAIFPCFLCSFLYVIYGPIDLLINNVTFFKFTYSTVAVHYVVLGIITACLSSALISSLKGKLFDYAICFVVGFGVASVVQGWINLDLGVLDGSTIMWNTYTDHALINLLIWAIIMLLPFATRYFFKQIARKMMYIVTVSLTGALVVSLIPALISTPAQEEDTTYLLSGEKQYTLSDKENIIIFVLDHFSNKYVDIMTSEFPNALDPLQDFTYYNNADSCYYSTFPSMMHMITGSDFDGTQLIDDYFREGWNSERAQSFFSLLHRNGFKVYLHSNEYLLGGADLMVGCIDNLAVSTQQFSVQVNYRALTKLVKLACFRYMPHALKANFAMFDNEFDDIVMVESNVDAIEFDNDAFYQELQNNGISIDKSNKIVSFQHIIGAHPPFTYDETITFRAEGTTCAQQSLACVKIVERYLSYLKELGIYDNSCIIITADHGGVNIDDKQPIFFIKEAGITRQEMKVSTAPISHDDLMATILANAELSTEAFGKSIYDFEEDEERERVFTTRGNSNAYPSEVQKYNAPDNVWGDNNVLIGFKYTGDSEDLIESAYYPENFIVTPLSESFY